MIYGTQPGWAYDRRRDLWALYDDRGQERGWVTAEFIARVPRGMAASAVRRRFGSAPPPLARVA